MANKSETFMCFEAATWWLCTHRTFKTLLQDSLCPNHYDNNSILLIGSWCICIWNRHEKGKDCAHANSVWDPLLPPVMYDWPFQGDASCFSLCGFLLCLFLLSSNHNLAFCTLFGLVSWHWLVKSWAFGFAFELFCFACRHAKPSVNTSFLPEAECI